MNLVMGVVVVDGLKTFPYEQPSYSNVYAVSSLECAYNGARDELRGIDEGLEEDLSEVVMTEVVKTEVLPAIFSTVDKFCEEMPSEVSVSEAAVMVEESKSGISGPADILPIMDSLDLVARGQEEKQMTRRPWVWTLSTVWR